MQRGRLDSRQPVLETFLLFHAQSKFHKCKSLRKRANALTIPHLTALRRWRMLITEAAVVMCDPARAMLFARIVLILAKRRTIRCLLKANSGGRLSYACISGQSIPHLHTLSARGSTASWQKLGCAGRPVGTQTAIFGLSLVIPVPSPGPPLRLAAREE